MLRMISRLSNPPSWVLSLFKNLNFLCQNCVLRSVFSSFALPVIRLWYALIAQQEKQSFPPFFGTHDNNKHILVKNKNVHLL